MFRARGAQRSEISKGKKLEGEGEEKGLDARKIRGKTQESLKGKNL